MSLSSRQIDAYGSDFCLIMRCQMALCFFWKPSLCLHGDATAGTFPISPQPEAKGRDLTALTTRGAECFHMFRTGNGRFTVKYTILLQPASPIKCTDVTFCSAVFGMFVCLFVCFRLGSELTRWVSIFRTARGLGRSSTSRPSRPPSPCSSGCRCDKDPPHYPHAQLLPPSDSLTLPH